VWQPAAWNSSTSVVFPIARLARNKNDLPLPLPGFAETAVQLGQGRVAAHDPFRSLGE